MKSLCILGVCALALEASAQEEPPVDGRRVLVVANRAWQGPDGREVGESEGVARYYMARRGVPNEHLLLVDVEQEEPDYPVFHRQVIVPLSRKLKELRGERDTDPILYIVCCYGMPIRINPGLADFVKAPPAKWEKTVYRPDGALTTYPRRTYRNRRAADSFLCYPHLLAGMPEDVAPDSGRNNFGDAFQDVNFAPPVVHPYYGLCVQPANPKPDPKLKIGINYSPQVEPPMSFAEARKRDPNAFADYLVCRLDAPTPRIARSLVDKAIYAEQYLECPGTRRAPTYATTSVFDLGEQATTAEQVQDAADWFAGKTHGSPFAGTPWPMIVDTGTELGQEIGIPDKDGQLYRPNDPAFKDRDFPISDVAWYYGHYTTWGRYQDVYQWAVGAVGVHMDSGCCAELHTKEFDTFADNPDPEWRPGFVPHALARNLTASSGTVHEPFEDGIIAANFLFRALSLGMPFADAAYAATRDIWWKSVAVGDPLYRPFGGDKSVDTEPPKILSASAELKDGRLSIRATTDKPCQFQVADASGQVLRPFSRWGATWDERDWFFGCEHETELKGTWKAGTDFVLSVRSPAALDAATGIRP